VIMMSGDKSKLLTQNVLLLQKNMERSISTIKQKMEQELQREWQKSRIQLQNMKVSFQALIQTCSTTFIHTSSVLMSSDSIPNIYFLYFRTNLLYLLCN
jgi:hypothetical protein